MAAKENVPENSTEKQDSAEKIMEKNTAKTGCLKAAANGRVIPMAEAKDEAFSS